MKLRAGSASRCPLGSSFNLSLSLSLCLSLSFFRQGYGQGRFLSLSLFLSLSVCLSLDRLRRRQRSSHPLHARAHTRCSLTGVNPPSTEFFHWRLICTGDGEERTVPAIAKSCHARQCESSPSSFRHAVWLSRHCAKQPSIYKELWQHEHKQRAGRTQHLFHVRGIPLFFASIECNHMPTYKDVRSSCLAFTSNQA